MAWRDTSSYSQSEPRESRQPNQFEIKSGDLRVSIHWLHGMDKGAWYMSCAELRIMASDLRTKKIKTAQMRAIAAVRARCAELNLQARALTALAKQKDV